MDILSNGVFMQRRRLSALLTAFLLALVLSCPPVAGHAAARAQPFTAAEPGGAVAAASNSVLFLFPNGTYMWDYAAPGTYHDAFNLTLGGAAHYGLGVNYALYQGVPFVEAIGGIWNSNSTALFDNAFWALWLWNGTTDAWMLSGVGASEVNLTATHSVAWSYSLYNPTTYLPYSPPQPTPVDPLPVPSYRGYSSGTAYNPAFTNGSVPVSYSHLSWKANAGAGGVDVQPVECNGLAYFITDGSSGTSAVLAYNTYGMLVWRHNISSLGFELASPLCSDGLLIVPSTDGSIYAFNATTGATAYVLPHLSSSPYGLTASPVAGPAGYFVQNGSGGVSYLSFNGTRIWNASLPGGSYYSTPAYSNGTLYCFSGNTTNSTLDAVNSSDGAILWTLSVAGTVYGAPSVSAERIYFVSSLRTAGVSGYTDVIVHCAVLSGGALVWNYSAGPSPAAPSSTAVARGLVIFASASSLVELNGSDGRLIWFMSTGNQFAAPSPYVLGDYVFSSSDSSDSRVTVTTLSGLPVWNYTVSQANDYSLSSPIFNGQTVFWGDDAGYVYAFQDLGVVNFTYTQSLGRVSLTGVLDPLITGSVNLTWEVNGAVHYGMVISQTFHTNGTYGVTLSAKYSDGTVATVSGSIVVSTVSSGAPPHHNGTAVNPYVIVEYAAIPAALVAIAVVAGLMRYRRGGRH